MGNTPVDPDDVRCITDYANSLTLEQAITALEEMDAIVELAWLSAARQQLEDTWVTSVMTAYASAKGELKSILLTLPEVEND